MSDTPNIRLDFSQDEIEFAPGLDFTMSESETRRQLALVATRNAAVRAAAGVLVAMPLTEIAMRSIEWLERPLWQRSAFQLLAGPKGAGKGTYLAGLAARLSREGTNVLFVSTEDSAEIDLKPRLVAASADIGHCFLIRQHVRLPDDVDELRRLAQSLGASGCS